MHPNDLYEKVVEVGAVLVDVRYRPFSKAPQWQKRAFIEKFGGFYMHVAAFGNKNYKGGPIEIAKPTEGLTLVMPVLAEQPIVLMCACPDYRKCHRTTVAQFLLDAWPNKDLPEIVNWTKEDMPSEQTPSNKSKRGTAREKRLLGLPPVQQLSFFGEHDAGTSYRPYIKKHSDES